MKRSGWLAAVLLALSGLLTACSSNPGGAKGEPSPSRTRPIIVFMTDFGTANDAVAVCKAVILNICPDCRTMDITHQVRPFSIADGARFLYDVTPYYGPNTVFLVVVDPGVGTSRRAVVVRTKKGQYFVLPDNGLLMPVADRDGLDGAREITNPAFMIGDRISSTFHGRDIFSPTAAHIAAGEDWTQVGPEVKELVRLKMPVAKLDEKGITGEIIGLDDPFGSLISNIPATEFRKLGYQLGDKVHVRVGDREFVAPFVRTFMDVSIGHILAYIDSRGRFGLALNERDFSKTYKVTPPAPIFIPRKGE